MQGVTGTTPEYKAMGLVGHELSKINGFDLDQLPEEVLRRAYFV
jgi:hypothetical protein